MNIVYFLTIILISIILIFTVSDKISYATQFETLSVSNSKLTRARSESGDYIPSDKLGSSEYCGHCHTEVFQQWNASAHHFSSFNNPVYRKVALLTLEKKGIDTLNFCASCHDPLPLLSGEIENLDLNSWSSNAGITCLSCHRITDVKGGNGNYIVSKPTLHPFALSESMLLQKAHKLLLKVTPWLHNVVMSKPLYESPEYCSTCHTLTVPKSINNSTDITQLDEYGQWKSSHFSGDLTNHNADSKKTCSDCHMQLVPSKDPAAKNGMIKSHSFTGGNTMLPALHRDDNHLIKTELFLKNNIIDLSISGVRTNKESLFKNPDTAVLSAGELMEIKLELRNIGVGHNFPAGTIDSNQAWLEVTATSSNNITIFESGIIDSNGEIPTGTISYGATFLDSNGNLTDRRNSTTEAVSIQDQRLIKPGKSDNVYYSIKIPSEAKLPITVNAKLNWRKYSPKFMHWVFDNRKIPEIPITVISEVNVVI